MIAACIAFVVLCFCIGLLGGYRWSRRQRQLTGEWPSFGQLMQKTERARSYAFYIGVAVCGLAYAIGYSTFALAALCTAATLAIPEAFKTARSDSH